MLSALVDRRLPSVHLLVAPGRSYNWIFALRHLLLGISVVVDLVTELAREDVLKVMLCADDSVFSCLHDHSDSCGCH